MDIRGIRDGAALVAEHVAGLVGACEQAGLRAEVVARSGRVRVSAPAAHPRMAETVTLRANVVGVLTWYYSWDAPIGPAHETAAVVAALKHVVSIEGL